MIPYKSGLERLWGEFFTHLGLNFAYNTASLPAFDFGHNIHAQIITEPADKPLSEMIAYGRKNNCLVATIAGLPRPNEYKIVLAGWWEGDILISMNPDTMEFLPVMFGYSTICEGVSFDIQESPNVVRPVYINQRFECEGTGCRHFVVTDSVLVPTTPLHAAFMATSNLETV